MLGEQQLVALTVLFRHGADDVQAALTKWLGRTVNIAVEQAEQAPLDRVGEMLGRPEAPICACVMSLSGRVNGQLMLAFDDASGLALADMLLERPAGSAIEWGELERSAAMETANIAGCAYLNALARFLQSAHGPCDLTPSPPRFMREFAESLIEFAVMNQAQSSNLLFLTRTEFRIEAAPVNWSLVFVPDAHWMSALQEMLPA